MLTCKEAAARVSQSMDRELSLGERLGLRLHLLICTACTRFKRQAEFLRRAAREYVRRDIEGTEPLRLSASARTRIQSTLPREHG
jgi:hypothetical protein